MPRSVWFIGFGALLVAALVLLPLSGAWLPDVVATSFSKGGIAEGFMSRGRFLGLSMLLTVGMPLMVVAIVGFAASRGVSLLRVPHRDHWFAPERRAASAEFMRLHIVRLGCAMVAFFAALHGLTLQANTKQPPSLPMSAALVPIALFALALLGWSIALRRRFRAPD